MIGYGFLNLLSGALFDAKILRHSLAMISYALAMVSCATDSSKLMISPHAL
jgi:hypothetical protein